MTLFEYTAIAFSLVFSFSALRLVSGLPHALDSKRRHWVHVAHVFIALVATLGVFWTFWSFRDVQWNWPTFLSALCGPGIIYFLVCTLIPDAPAEVVSWRDYFFETRRRYFFGVCAWSVVLSMNATVLAQLPLLHPVRIIYLIILCTGLAGAFSDSPRVHAGIIIGALVAILMFSVLLFSPGSLAA